MEMTAGLKNLGTVAQVGTYRKLSARVRALPLTIKLLGTILGLAIIPLLVVAYFSERTARDILLDAKREDLHTHAVGVMASIDNTMEIRRTEAATVAKGPMITTYTDDPGNAKNAQALLGAFQILMSSQLDIKAIFLVDAASGSVTLSTSSNRGRNMGSRAFIKAAAGGENSISEPSRDDGINFVYYASPVRDRGGRLSQVMVLGIAAEELWGILRTETGRLGNGSLAIMTDDAGVRIGHSTTSGLEFKSWVALDEATAGTLIAEQRYGNDVTEITNTEYGEVATRVISSNPPANIVEHQLAVSDETYESGVARSSLKPWTIIESVPHSTFMAPVERLRYLTILIIGAAVFAISLLVLLVSHIATLPIRQLILAVQKMSEGDMASPVPDIPDKELGTLANGFDVLRRKVSDSHDELRRGYIDLARALVTSLEARDPDTAGHTERVGQYALAVSRQL
ncbi:MAG: cache and HAMP domain-containing protein, partial [Actinomycetota bacterium]